MSDQDENNKNQDFNFGGEIVPTKVFGFEYKNIFSPSESLEDMPRRMEERIRKVRRFSKQNIFEHPFKASE